MLISSSPSVRFHRFQALPTTGGLHFSGQEDSWQPPAPLQKALDKTYKPLTRLAIAGTLLSTLLPNGTVSNVPRLAPSGEYEFQVTPVGTKTYVFKRLNILALLLIANWLLQERGRRHQIAATHKLGIALGGCETASQGKFQNSAEWRKRFLQLKHEFDKAKNNNSLWHDHMLKVRPVYQEMLRARAVTLACTQLLEGYILGQNFHGFNCNWLEDPDDNRDSLDKMTLEQVVQDIAICDAPPDSWKPFSLKQLKEQARKEAFADAEKLLTGLDRSTIQTLYEEVLKQLEMGRDDWSSISMDNLAHRAGLPLPQKDKPAESWQVTA